MMEEKELEQAACIDADPEIFFGGTPDDIATAKSYCGICPVVAQCLATALAGDEYGIWGGTTLRERLRVRGNPRAIKELLISVTSK